MRKGFLSLSLILALAGSSWAQEITNVSFTQDGEISKLIIETDKPSFAERFHVTEDKQIILDIKNVKVSPKLLRGIDTSEFPGSAVFISGYKKPGTTSDIRFAVQLRDNVRSVLEATENKIVLNIENRFGVFSKNKIQAPSATTADATQDEDTIGINVPKSSSVEDILQNLTMAGPKKYVGRRISINVRNIPVVDVLNMIAETSGFNIIVDQAIEKLPPVTLALTNIPWDQALDTVMKISKLSAEKSANILIVETQEQANKEREDESKLAALQTRNEPLVTRVFLINYATLADIAKIIADYLTPERSSIQTDERTNSLIVKDTVESIERVKKIIETLDTQTPQILIEAKIVEAADTYAKRIGLAQGVRFGYDPFSPVSSTQGQLGTIAGPGFSFASATGRDTPTTLGLNVAVFKRLLGLDFQLQLMESESKGRIISTPKVVTQNKKAATISSTSETSFATFTQTVGSPAIGGFDTVSATLNLTVTPQVTNDGAISMAISVRKQSFLTRPADGAPPDKSTRDITTNVLVDNGSTIVIGGLYQTETNEIIEGIPVLKDLPLIGWLFRNPISPETTKNELIIFLTPRIMNQDEAGFTERKASAPGTVNEL